MKLQSWIVILKDVILLDISVNETSIKDLKPSSSSS